MALAVYGKHPAKGDFLEYGVPEALKPGLEAWLDAVLAEARAVLAAEWDRVWLNAPMLRFWIGDGIWGAPVAGVMAASQDRVGRRFPLVLLALGGVPPPVIDPDQGWYDAACLHLAGQLARVDLGVPELGVPDLGVAAALLSGAPVPAGADAAAGPRDFWAVTPGPLVAGLLSDITLTDHRRASETRSYWWVAGAPDAEAPAVPAVELPSAEPEPEPEPELESEPESAAESAAEPELVEVDAPEVAAELVADEAVSEAVDWALPEADFAAEPEADSSPFDAPAGGYGLFQPPEPGAALMPDLPELPAALLPVPEPRPLWSQVWAGPGLPSGAVLAWFFRGYAGEV